MRAFLTESEVLAKRLDQKLLNREESEDEEMKIKALTLGSDTPASPFRGEGELFEDVYDLGDQISFGAEAVVYRAIRRSDGQVFAARQVHHMVNGVPTARTPSDVATEVDRLVAVKCSQVIEVVDFFQSENCSTVVMELCQSDLLQACALHGGQWTELQVKRCIVEVLLGLQRIHALGYVHNDIKIENILVHDPVTLSGVKICDFGISKLNGEQAPIETSWYNMCPETVKAIYEHDGNVATVIAHSEKLDIWPVGILLYQLLTGLRMFYDARSQEQHAVMSRIASVSMASWNTVHIKSHFRKPPHYRFVDSDLTAFFRSIFQTDPDQRPSAEQLLQSKWLKPVVDQRDEARVVKAMAVRSVRAYSECSSSNCGTPMVATLPYSSSYSSDGGPQSPCGFPVDGPKFVPAGSLPRVATGGTKRSSVDGTTAIAPKDVDRTSHASSLALGARNWEEGA